MKNGSLVTQVLRWISGLFDDTFQRNDNGVAPNTPLPLSPEAELEFMWNAFANLNDWVRFSDTKAAAVLAANGVIVVSIATWLAGTHSETVNSWEAVTWLALILVATFYSSAYALNSLLPNLLAPTRRRRTSEVSSSLIFFADIARSFPSSNLFHQTVRQALSDPDRAVAELSQQIWANSKVAATKYANVSKAILGLATASGLGFVGVIVLAVIKLERSV